MDTPGGHEVWVQAAAHMVLYKASSAYIMQAFEAVKLSNIHVRWMTIMPRWGNLLKEVGEDTYMQMPAGHSSW